MPGRRIVVSMSFAVGFLTLLASFTNANVQVGQGTNSCPRCQFCADTYMTEAILKQMASVNISEDTEDVYSTVCWNVNDFLTSDSTEGTFNNIDENGDDVISRNELQLYLTDFADALDDWVDRLLSEMTGVVNAKGAASVSREDFARTRCPTKIVFCRYAEFLRKLLLCPKTIQWCP
jgi:hypothetical protein